MVFRVAFVATFLFSMIAVSVYAFSVLAILSYWLYYHILSADKPFSFVLFVLGQYLLMGILIAIVGVISIVAFPKTLKMLERESTKLAQELDLSAPLRGRDFITMKGWLKFASKWGIRRTVLLYWLFMAAILGGVSFILKSLYGIMSMTFIMAYTTTFSTGYTIIFYRQIKGLVRSPS